MQINDCEFRGADRIRQARVDRTQEAVHRVEDWALRLVRNTLEIPTMVESLTAARAEIDAILRDERYRRAGGVFIEGEMTADDRENRAVSLRSRLAGSLMRWRWRCFSRRRGTVNRGASRDSEGLKVSNLKPCPFCGGEAERFGTKEKI
jgi:hypothetical protein